MEISIKIKTDNAAFCSSEEFDADMYDNAEEMKEEADEDARDQEVNRILRKVVVDMEHGYRQGRCIDTNGNHVGDWAICYAASEKD